MNTEGILRMSAKDLAFNSEETKAPEKATPRLDSKGVVLNPGRYSAEIQAQMKKKATAKDIINQAYRHLNIAKNLKWQLCGTLIAVEDFENMETEIEAVRSIIPDAKFTTNMMMFFPLLDYRKFADKLDVISWDAYPQLHNDYESLFDTFQEAGFTHALMRSLKKQPFMLMESTPSKVNWRKYNKLKKPGVHELACLQALANGSDTVQYFQIRAARGAYEMFHGAVIGHDGTENARTFKDVENVGSILNTIKEIKGTMTKAQVALVVDYDTRWALWTAKSFNSEDKKYEKTVIEFYKQLQRFGVDVDIIAQEDNFDNYKLIIAPMMFLLEKGTGEKIRKYVNNGGNILSTYITGYVNENQLALLGGFPGDGLMDVFGIEVEDIDVLWPLQSNTVEYNNSSIKAYDYCDILKNAKADILATYKSDFYENTPAITSNRYGEGKAYYLAFRSDLNELNDFFKLIFNEADVAYKELPPDVEYHVRYSDTNSYEFYLNESEEEKTVEVNGNDLLSGNTYNGAVTLKPYKSLIIKK